MTLFRRSSACSSCVVQEENAGMAAQICGLCILLGRQMIPTICRQATGGRAHGLRDNLPVGLFRDHTSRLSVQEAPVRTPLTNPPSILLIASFLSGTWADRNTRRSHAVIPLPLHRGDIFGFVFSSQYFCNLLIFSLVGLKHTTCKYCKIS